MARRIFKVKGWLRYKINFDSNHYPKSFNFQLLEGHSPPSRHSCANRNLTLWKTYQTKTSLRFRRFLIFAASCPIVIQPPYRHSCANRNLILWKTYQTKTSLRLRRFLIFSASWRIVRNSEYGEGSVTIDETAIRDGVIRNHPSEIRNFLIVLLWRI